ncbi:MAG TPA: hypothetical protein VMF70_04585 [Gemmatimonadales bacterium]|nr:hypothetical protein [Gemmatimonadales bacterium]
MSWLLQYGCPAIRYRTLTEIVGSSDSAQLEALRPELEAYPPARQIAKKQKDTGVWGGNLLGVSPNKAAGIKDVGTIHQYRRLVELCWPQDSRPLKLAGRLLYRLLSRDSDPKLLFEFQKFGAAEPGVEPWIREIVREAAAAALAHVGNGDDPRVRGAAHKIANAVSQFLRSELVDDPLVKTSQGWVLRPGAYPPTLFSVTLLAMLPAVQRERAGLVERLGSYLAQPATKKSFGVAAGKKVLKPSFVLLGDPLKVAASGQPDDLPFALHWMEILARLGVLQRSATATRVWARLLKDCDDQGVWTPKNLRAIPRRISPWSYHAFPLQADARTPESRQADVTFRMSLISRLAGWEIASV